MTDERSSKDQAQPQPDTLTLDEDEARHVTGVPEEVARKLALANSGAMLVIGCISWTPTLRGVDINSATFVKSLLALKCANLLRLNSMGLSLGYYSGGAILLRSAFESLAYLCLFHEDPDEIRAWLRVELHPGLERQQRAEDQRGQFNRARSSFARRAHDVQIERDLVRFLWDKTSRNVHASALALAQEFGIDVRDFLPDEFWIALEKAGDDWGFALDLLAWKAVDTRAWTLAKNQGGLEKEEAQFEIIGRFDEEELDLLSIMALLLTHRLAELVFDTFEVVNRVLQSDFDRWHTEVQKL